MNAVNNHAIVIGGGFAGLTVARVLADHFTHVTVIERDFFDDEKHGHKGVPQAHHAHGLTNKGARALEGLFPGLRAELALAGSPVFDHGEGVSTWLPCGPIPMSTSGIEIQAFTRHLLDSCLRRRALEMSGVNICDGLEVTGLQMDSTGRQVVGVLQRGRTRFPAISHEQSRLMRADFVVDASGRFSAMPAWLVEIGFPAVQESVVDPKITYSSCTFKGPPKTWRALYQWADPPDSPRGAYALYTESHEWLITLYGAAGDMPPTREANYRAFSASLRNPVLDQLLAESAMTSAIHRYVRTENRLRAFHLMPAWPDGLVVLGDAFCAFNPKYGQGLTLAVLEAIKLGELLSQHGNATMRPGLAKKFQKHLSTLVVWPWRLATGEDLLWEAKMRGEKGPLLARSFHRYKALLYHAVAKDVKLYGVFLSVFHMMRMPAYLFRPFVILRIATVCLLASPFFKRRSTKS